MRYNVHPPHAFRNRIAKSIGVLVAAALVATLGLPSAAQAQASITPGTPAVTFTMDDGFSIAAPLAVGKGMYWRVIYTQPNGTEGMMPEDDDPAAGAGTAIKVEADRVSDHGTWQFKARYYTTNVVETEKPAGPASTAREYTIGEAPAPSNFHASASPRGYVLTWSDKRTTDGGGDTAALRTETGIVRYQFRSGSDADWSDVTVGKIISDLEPGEYTFMLRAITKETNGDSASRDDDANDIKMDDVVGTPASTMVMVPMPTPTLPEIAALLLAMLLLGSGAYLLRRRQSGGLTYA